MVFVDSNVILDVITADPPSKKNRNPVRLHHGPGWCPRSAEDQADHAVRVTPSIGDVTARASVSKVGG